MSKIKVFDKTGKYATNRDVADTVFDDISKLLSNTTDIIEIDFIDVEIIVCSFWSHAIAHLLKDFTNEVLNSRIQIINITVYQSNTLDLVLDNAKKFYQKC